MYSSTTVSGGLDWSARCQYDTYLHCTLYIGTVRTRKLGTARDRSFDASPHRQGWPMTGTDERLLVQRTRDHTIRHFSAGCQEKAIEPSPYRTRGDLASISAKRKARMPGS